MYCLHPYCYEPQQITSAMLETESTLDLTLYNPQLDTQESIVKLMLFGKKAALYTNIIRHPLIELVFRYNNLVCNVSSLF